MKHKLVTMPWSWTGSGLLPRAVSDRNQFLKASVGKCATQKCLSRALPNQPFPQEFLITNRNLLAYSVQIVASKMIESKPKSLLRLTEKNRFHSIDASGSGNVLSSLNDSNKPASSSFLDRDPMALKSAAARENIQCPIS